MNEPREIIGICDQQFFEMQAMAIRSLREWGGAPDIQMVVYDFGLSAKVRRWFEVNNVLVREIDWLEAGIEDFQPRVYDRRFLLWVAKTWAIMDSARRVTDDGLTMFFDGDMLVMPPTTLDVYCKRVFDAAEKGIVAVRDPFTFEQASFYVTNTTKRFDPDYWPKVHKVECNAITWNIGMVAGPGAKLAAAFEPWIEAIFSWARDPHPDVGPLCVDQFVFSVLAESGAIQVQELPPEYNLTRVFWTDQPSLIPHARAIHLTGPIKPWQPAGACHPMTILYTRLAEQLCEGRA